jgi:polar amino acid transport system substrate-binding protein
MSPRTLSRFSLLFVVLALATVLAFAACKDDKKDAGKTPSTGAIDISGVAELEDGDLLMGSDIAYPPIESYEEGTQNAVGLDIDIIKGIAELLGVEVKFQQVGSFEGIVGDLVAKRYDIIMSAISITPERQAEIDFVAYFGPVGTGILVPTGNPEGIQGMEDLCGRPVAAQLGTYQVDQMNAANADVCKDNNIDVRPFPDNPAAVQELALGRVDAELADDPVAAYSALQSDGELEVVVTEIEAAEYGIGVRKDSAELKAVLEEALQKLIDDGTYGQILEDWGQTNFAIQ